MESFEHSPAGAVHVQFDIVAHSAGGKQAIYPPCCDEFLLNDDIQKSIAFGEYLTRLRTLSLVLKNPRINAFQSPGVEERRPVDEFTQRRQGKVVKHTHAGKGGRGQIFGTPLDRSPPLAGGLDGNYCQARRGVGLANRFVIGAMLSYERWLALIAQEARGHGHCPAGIQHVDHWLAVMWGNLNRRVRPARGRTANEQRQLEALTLHLARHMHHLVKRRSDQAAESDHVRFFGFGTFEDLFAGDHHSHVDHFIVVARQYDSDDILANVVNVTFDRREYDFSLRFNHFASSSPGFLLGFHERR